MTSAGLSGTNNLFDFFHDRVNAAATHQKAPVSEEGIFYLANLLAERSRSPEGGPQTLVELSLQARTSDHSGAVRSYREAGDRALYLSGFFRQHIRSRRSLVDIDYYLHMGAAAYASLSALLAPHRARDSQGGHKALPDLFAELSARFQACSEVLFEVEQEVRAEAVTPGSVSDAEVLALYERWLETGSRAAARRLQALGLLPARGSGEPC